ncbi:putative pentatricopeptide repeat-containing protein At5g37570 [Phalaenopsis equestris]|uniref:putative pentatricopeptide repeat-containing protein At5g37570 n=1 Tax=Phalaenopsis equestris TaxID=78828 RepID=UPI0009E422EF|nr:putative pentatricopeptide repeat-containing protein At5g37570 [Phalaenopsis equestris]
MLPSVNEPYRFVEQSLFSLLHKCRLSDHLFQIQSQIIIHGLLQSRRLAPKSAIAFFESSNPQSARQLFDQILQPDTVLWNVMFKGSAEAGLHRETLLLFTQMKRRDVRPNLFTFPFVIKSCSMIPARMAGDQVHCFALKTGLRSNLFVGTSLIEMYAIKVGAGLAYKMFEDMPERNVVVWTAIIRAYIAVGDMKNAFNLFNQLEEHDVIVWGTMISAFIEHGDIATAEELFASMPVRDVQSWNTMLFGYANVDFIGACERFFAIMPVKNVFSWNGLIQGHARHAWCSRLGEMDPFVF